MNEWNYEKDPIAGQAEVFRGMWAGAAEKYAHLKQRFEEAKKLPETEPADNEAPHDVAGELAEELTELDLLRADLADILVVALYHWAERAMKHRLVERGTPKATVRAADFKEVGTLFKSHGVELAKLKEASAVTTIMRKLANSWKHQSGSGMDSKASAALALTTTPLEHLGDPGVRKALKGALAVGDDDLESLVLEMIQVTEDFVGAVAKA